MQGKVVVITGANSGLGKATAVELAKRGAHIVMAVRNAAKGEAAKRDIEEQSLSKDIELMSLDLASLASVRSFAEEFLAAHDRLDVLVNNAGLMLSKRTETPDGFETTFGVNHLGHFLLTELLRERLVSSAPGRVVILSSGAHKAAGKGLDFDDLQSQRTYRAFQVYGRSKLANILHTRELARRLQGTGVTANAVHPGWVHTNFAGEGDTGKVLQRASAFAGRLFARTPEEGARTTVRLASDPALAATTGEYFFSERQVKVSKAARDDAAAARLWQVSERLVGLA